MALVGLGAFLLATTAVGIRLLWLSHRTERLPEFAMGIGFLFTGACSQLLFVLGKEGALGPGLAEVAVFTARGFQIAGGTALCIFTWRVFRPEASWARLATIVFFPVSLLIWAGSVRYQGAGAAYLDLFWWWAIMVPRTIPYLWMAFEAVVYARRLGRRLPLGLTDPWSARRMGLWAGGASAATAIYAAQMLEVAVRGTSELGVASAASNSFLGLVAAACITLAFFPPRAYRARVERRAGARA